jgi:hypothetical protein
VNKASLQFCKWTVRERERESNVAGFKLLLCEKSVFRVAGVVQISWQLDACDKVIILSAPLKGMRVTSRMAVLAAYA